MNNNDEKIKQLITTIKTKKDALGLKPKAHYETNGILPTIDGGKNINTINKLDECIRITSLILQSKSSYEAACDFLELPKNGEELQNIEKQLKDLKLRSWIIAYDIEKKKLDELEKQLNTLKSAELKTSDALESIVSSLS